MAPGYDSRQARTGLKGLTKPDPKDQAAQIVAWAICWPWNLVWTLCVYNPFRYVGEFLLKEIQAALFEISDGQFSVIEQDLTLDTPPAPYPIPVQQLTSEVTPPDRPAGNKAAATQATTARPLQSGADTNESVLPLDTPDTDQKPNTEPARAEYAQTAEDAGPPLNDEPAIKPSPARRPLINTVENLQATTEAELAEGESSDSYAWAPPASKSFVPVSNRPLRAVKYEAGSTTPAVKLTGSVKPESDHWFKKHTPN